MPVEEVEIIPINLLPTAAPSSINLTTNIPVGIVGDSNSKKTSLQVMAEVISEQIGSVTIPDPFYYRVDGVEPTDPPSTDGGLANRNVPDPALDGLDYTLHKWGVGPLRKGIEWQNDIAGGGWRLLDADLLTNEMYVAIAKPVVSNILSAPDAIARFTSGVALYPADGTIISAHFRKEIIITGAKNITLPDVNSYPENVALFIYSSDGPHRQTTFTAAAGQFIYSQAGTLNKFYLSNREYATLIRVADTWYMVAQSDMVFKTPYLSDGWLPGTNQFAADGTERNRADYPKVWDFIQRLKAAIPDAVKTGAQWTTNQTYWGEGNGTTTFNTPNFRGYFVRSLNGTQSPAIDPSRSPTENNTPGSIQGSANLAHDHTVSLGDTAGRSDNANDRDVMIPGTRNNQTSSSGGPESRPINVGMFKYINY